MTVLRQYSDLVQLRQVERAVRNAHLLYTSAEEASSEASTQTTPGVVHTKSSVLTETIELGGRPALGSQADDRRSLFSIFLYTRQSPIARSLADRDIGLAPPAARSAEIESQVTTTARSYRIVSSGFGCPHDWSGWRSALVIVKPATVIAWHRKGFRLYSTWQEPCPLRSTPHSQGNQ